MKYSLTLLALVIFAGSCMKESGKSLTKADTFIRYFNGGYNDQAITVAETADKGFIVLATTEVKTSDAAASRYKVKLIKTDAAGIPVWTSVFPPYGSPGSYRAHDLQILTQGGYVITGEDIHSDTAKSKVLLLRVDESGNEVAVTSRGKRIGTAVAQTASGDFLVLSSRGTTSMVLTAFKNNTTLDSMWSKSYSAGSLTNLASRLLIDNAGKAIWSGTVEKSNVTGIRLVKTAQNVQNTDFDLLLLNPGFSEVSNDFCPYGFGFAMIGSTTQTDKGDKDILFKRLSQNGEELPGGRASFGFSGQDDIGYSLSATQDGGLILLSSVNTKVISGVDNDLDHFLIKIDAFGAESFRSYFGSRFKDTGAAVRQVSDGNYIVLGTSTQGGLQIIMLAKTDPAGKIQ